MHHPEPPTRHDNRLSTPRLNEPHRRGIRLAAISPLTGPWTAYGRAHLYGLRLAVDEINQRGGVLGHPLQVTVADSESDPRQAAHQARRLVLEQGARFVIGTFSSLERQAAAKALLGSDALLLYPTFYEGQTTDTYNPNVFLFGQDPRQQVLPHLGWLMHKHGGRFFLLGSDYTWPRKTNALVRKWVEAAGGKVIGEVYLSLGTRQFTPVIHRIDAARPDVLLHSIAAYDSIAFRLEWHRRGMTEKVVLWSINDEELVTARIGSTAAAGAYASFDYFMGLRHPNNQVFLARLRQRFGRDVMISTVGVAMYNATHILADAIEKAGTLDTSAVRDTLRNMRFEGAPQGCVWMLAEENQLVLPSYLLLVREKWSSGEEIFQVVREVSAHEVEAGIVERPGGV